MSWFSMGLVFGALFGFAAGLEAVWWCAGFMLLVLVIDLWPKK